MICTSCHLGFMLIITYRSEWRKCGLCGFCLRCEEPLKEVGLSAPTPSPFPEPVQKDYSSDADLG
jgi:hypothetical protein